MCLFFFFWDNKLILFTLEKSLTIIILIYISGWQLYILNRRAPSLSCMLINMKDASQHNARPPPRAPSLRSKRGKGMMEGHYLLLLLPIILPLNWSFFVCCVHVNQTLICQTFCQFCHKIGQFSKPFANNATKIPFC